MSQFSCQNLKGVLGHASAILRRPKPSQKFTGVQENVLVELLKTSAASGDHTVAESVAEVLRTFKSTLMDESEISQWVVQSKWNSPKFEVYSSVTNTFVKPLCPPSMWFGERIVKSRPFLRNDGEFQAMLENRNGNDFVKVFDQLYMLVDSIGRVKDIKWFILALRSQPKFKKLLVHEQNISELVHRMSIRAHCLSSPSFLVLNQDLVQFITKECFDLNMRIPIEKQAKGCIKSIMRLAMRCKCLRVAEELMKSQFSPTVSTAELAQWVASAGKLYNSHEWDLLFSTNEYGPLSPVLRYHEYHPNLKAADLEEHVDILFQTVKQNGQHLHHIPSRDSLYNALVDLISMDQSVFDKVSMALYSIPSDQIVNLSVLKKIDRTFQELLESDEDVDVTVLYERLFRRLSGVNYLPKEAVLEILYILEELDELSAKGNFFPSSELFESALIAILSLQTEKELIFLNNVYCNWLKRCTGIQKDPSEPLLLLFDSRTPGFVAKVLQSLIDRKCCEIVVYILEQCIQKGVHISLQDGYMNKLFRVLLNSFSEDEIIRLVEQSFIPNSSRK